MSATERVEQAAIEAAEAYARVNAAAGPRRVCAGLVLAGMVIASKASIESQQVLVHGYLAQHPDAREPMSRWAERLSQAAES